MFSIFERKKNISVSWTILIILFGLSITFGVFFLSTPVHAQDQFIGDEGVSGIVPCGDAGEPSCDACQLVALSQDVINFGVYFVIFVATLVIVWAGFLYVTAQGNPGKLSSAHKIFTTVIVGLILVLAAWLIVDLLMSAFYDEKKFGFWNEILCQQAGAGTTGDTTTGDDGGVVVVPPSGTEGTLSHAEAEALIAAANANGANVSVTSTRDIVLPDCTGVSNCTTLNGIQQATLEEAIGFSTACGCGVIITGGTETTGGHTTTGTTNHLTGHKLDIEDTTVVNNFITDSKSGNFSRTGTRGDGAALYTSNSSGAIYAKEGSHWDILVDI